MKNLYKILLIITLGLFTAGIATASLGEYWSTISHLIPRTNDAVDIGSTAARVRAFFTNDLTFYDEIKPDNVTCSNGEILKKTGADNWDCATDDTGAGGSGAPTGADYLVGTATSTLSAEIVVGTNPGGELGNTWASPTIDDNVEVSNWTLLSPNVENYIIFNDEDDSPAVAPYISWRRRRDGTPTYNVSNGDRLASMNFYGWYNTYYTGATIKVISDGAPGVSDMPARMEFETSADGSSNPTLRMVIDSSGNIKMGDGNWTNYAQISNSGALTFAGSGDIDLPANSIDEVDLKAVNEPTDEYVLTYEATTGDFEWEVDQTGAGGSAIVFDIGDDGGNDSVDVNEIATTGDTNTIFTEPTADKILIAVGNNWPTADLASTLTVADESTATTTYIGYYTAATGSLAAKTGSNLTFNSATGMLTATGFTGNVTGDCSGSSGTCSGLAATATALAGNGGNCNAGNSPLGVDASGAVESCFDVWTEAENTAAGYTSNAGDIEDVFDCSTGDCGTITVGTSEWLIYGTGFIDANRFAGVTTVDATEFGYLNGLTAAIVQAGSASHDGFSDFVANEHLDWTGDLGATNLHTGNYPITDTEVPNNITIDLATLASTITVADESADTSCFVGYFTGASGSLAAKTGTNLTFNSSSGILTATGFAGALTGNVTGNCSGSSGTCTGEAATVATINGLAPNTATTQAAQGNITSLGTLTGLTMSGDIAMGGNNIDNGGVIFLTEQADADADVAGKGQIWVNTATPNELWWTDDAGTDTQLGTAGATAWDDIGNPDAADEIDFGAFITELNVADFRIGDGGANYVKFAGSGAITFAGTGDIDLPNDSVDDADINWGGLTDLAAGGVLSGDCVDETHIADNGIDSEHYNDGSIDGIHLAADTITHAYIADADQTITVCMYIEDPVAADDLKSIWANKTANAFLFTEIWGESDQTVSFDLQVDDGSPADVSGTDIAPAAGEAEDTTLAGDTTLAAGEELDLIITSVTNTPTWVSICWTGNWVD